MVIKPKPCKYCGGTNHQSFQCFKRPKKPSKPKAVKPLKRTAIKVKIDYKWLATRREWFSLHPPDHAGYYYCKIVPCLLPGVPMLQAEVALDHIKPKGKYRELKYVLSNLRESHHLCNNEKGSLSDEQYQAKMERLGVWINPAKNRTKNS